MRMMYIRDLVDHLKRRNKEVTLERI